MDTEARPPAPDAVEPAASASAVPKVSPIPAAHPPLRRDASPLDSKDRTTDTDAPPSSLPSVADPETSHVALVSASRTWNHTRTPASFTQPEGGPPMVWQRWPARLERAARIRGLDAQVRAFAEATSETMFDTIIPAREKVVETVPEYEPPRGFALVIAIFAIGFRELPRWLLITGSAIAFALGAAGALYWGPGH